MPGGFSNMSLRKKPTTTVEAEVFSDGYDADLFGNDEDRQQLMMMNEVEREAILYDRAQKVKVSFLET